MNMFVKNCAKIRGKLAGNWRHLQNKGGGWRGASGQSDEGKGPALWPGLRPLIGGGGFFFF